MKKHITFKDCRPWQDLVIVPVFNLFIAKAANGKCATWTPRQTLRLIASAIRNGGQVVFHKAVR